MPNDDERLTKIPAPKRPQQQPEKTGDTVAMLVVVLLLIAIVANSPNKTPKGNTDTVDTTAMVGTATAQKSSPDTIQIERYASPFDSMIDKMFNPKHK